MDSDNDSDNSNDGPIHRRRTQGTRPLPTQSSHHNNSMHRISSASNADRTYHPTKEDTTYSDDDEIDEDAVDRVPIDLDGYSVKIEDGCFRWSNVDGDSLVLKK